MLQYDSETMKELVRSKTAKKMIIGRLVSCLWFSFAVTATTLGQSDIYVGGSWASADRANRSANVNQATGAVSYSVPLTSFREGDLRIDVTAGYASAGQVVAEKGDYIGVGWDLNVGGSLTREVRGVPDDALNGRWLIEYDDGLGQHRREAAAGLRDSEYDIFRYQAGSYSGAFYVTADYKVVEIPETDCKVIPRSFANSDEAKEIIGFQIHTPDGIEYRFGGFEPGKVLVNSIRTWVDGNESQYRWYPAVAHGQAVGVNREHYFPMEYLLQSIRSPARSYVQYKYNGTLRLERNYPVGIAKAILTPEQMDRVHWLLRRTDHNVIHREEYKYELERIESRDGRGLRFTYEDSDNDLNQRVLKSIVSMPYVANEEVQFAYGRYETDYLDVESDPNKPSYVTEIRRHGTAGQAKKIRLDAIRFGSSRANLGEYRFDYYEGKLSYPYPTYYSLSSGERIYISRTDYAGHASNPNWYHGYETVSSGRVSNPFETGNRDPDADIAKVGMLKRVTIPNGGTTSFEYEGNERALYVEETVSVKHDCLPNDCQDSRSEYATFTVGEHNIQGARLRTTTKGPPYSGYGRMVLTIWKQFSPSAREEIKYSIQPILQTTDIDLETLLEETFGTSDIYGRYLVSVDIEAGIDPNTTVAFSGEVEVALTPANGAEPVSGMRVSKVTTDASVPSAGLRREKHEVVYNYSFGTGGVNGQSSGFTRGKPRLWEVSDRRVEVSSSTMSSLQFASGSTVMYGAVKARSAYGGSVLSQYAHPDKIALERDWAPRTRSIVYSPMEGILKSTLVFDDESDEPHRVTRYKYEQLNSLDGETQYQVRESKEGHIISDSYTHPRCVVGRVEQQSIVVDGRERVVNFVYHDYNLNAADDPTRSGLFSPSVTEKTVTHADGTTETEHIRYTIDYARDQSVIDKLRSKNIVGVPYIRSNASDGKQHSSRQINYSLFNDQGYPTSDPNARIITVKSVYQHGAATTRDGASIQSMSGQRRTIRDVLRVFHDGTPREWKAYGSELISRITRNADNLVEREELIDNGGTTRAVTVHTYYDDHRLESTTAPNGTTTRFTYDDARRTQKVVNECSGDAVEREYSPLHNVPGALPMSRTSYRYGSSNSNWHSTWNTLDGSGQVIQIVASGTNVNQPNAGTNGNGLVHSLATYDGLGRKTVEYLPITRQKSLSEWDYGRKMMSPSGSIRRQSYSYDTRGRIRTTTRPDASTLTYYYDRNTQPVRNVGYRGGSYPRGSLQKITTKDNWTFYTETYVNDRGQKVRTLNRAPNGTIFGLVDYGYDIKGQLYRVVPGDIDVETDAQQYLYRYNALGEIISKRTPGQSLEERYLYNAQGQIAAHRTAATAEEDKFWAYIYDVYGNIQTVGLLSGREYIASSIDSREVYMSYLYNYTQGRADFNTRRWAKTFLLDGSLRSDGTRRFVVERSIRSNADGAGGCGAIESLTFDHMPGSTGGSFTLGFEYDDTNRPWRTTEDIEYGSESTEITEWSNFTADRALDGVYLDVRSGGQLKVQAKLLELEYDRHGELVRERFGQDRLHTSEHNRRWIQERNYRYDVLGRLTHVNQPLVDESSSNYLKAASGFNGPKPVRKRYGQANKDLFYEELRYGADGAVFGGAATDYEHGDHIRSIVRSVRGRRPTIETYGYDGGHRLVDYEAYETPSSSDVSVVDANRIVARADYRYDPLNRPTSINRASLGTFFSPVADVATFDMLQYTYTTEGRPSAITDNSYVRGGHSRRVSGQPDGYSYDDCGRVTYDPYRRLASEYNVLGLLARTTSHNWSDSGAATDYIYAADGRLVETVAFDADGTQLAHVYHHRGHRYDSQRSELYLAHAEGASVLHLESGSAALIGYEADYLGNIVLTYTDANHDGWVDLSDSNELLEEQHYFPYGLKRQGYGRQRSGLPYAYNGAEWDERFSQHLTTYRTMAPATGLWGQVDPKADWLPGQSPYAAMNGNPITYSDPHGDIDPVTLATAVVTAAKVAKVGIGAKIAIGLGGAGVAGLGLYTAGTLACPTCFNAYNPYQLPTATVYANPPAPPPSVAPQSLSAVGAPSPATIAHMANAHTILKHTGKTLSGAGLTSTFVGQLQSQRLYSRGVRLNAVTGRNYTLSRANAARFTNGPFAARISARPTLLNASMPRTGLGTAGRVLGQTGSVLGHVGYGYEAYQFAFNNPGYSNISRGRFAYHTLAYGASTYAASAYGGPYGLAVGAIMLSAEVSAPLYYHAAQQAYNVVGAETAHGMNQFSSQWNDPDFWSYGPQ